MALGAVHGQIIVLSWSFLSRNIIIPTKALDTAAITTTTAVVAAVLSSTSSVRCFVDSPPCWCGCSGVIRCDCAVILLVTTMVVVEMVVIVMVVENG